MFHNVVWFLITMQRYILKFIFQIFFYFLSKIYACNLKIAVCVPKIPIGRKKIKIPVRLKISVEPKNYGLKIPVRVCMCVRMYARMYARAYDCGQIVIRTHDHDQHTNGHTNGTHDHNRKESNHKHKNKICLYYRYDCQK